MSTARFAAPIRQPSGNAHPHGVAFPLAATKPEGPRAWRMGAFDFETKGLHGAAVYGTLQFEVEACGERSRVLGFRARAAMPVEDALLAAMIAANAPNMRWYAHNAEYDLIYLIDAARRLQAKGVIRDIEPVMRGDRAIFRVIFHLAEGAPLDCYDSMALAANGGKGISLEKFAAAMSTVGGKLKTIDFESGEIFDPGKSAHRDYAKQDTRVLLDSMVNFDRQVWEHYGVHVKGTIGATALKAWQVTLPAGERYWRLDPEREGYAREAYFGGLAFLTSTRKHRDVVSLDVNSMYPHCMRFYGVPAGEIRTVRKFDDGSWRPAPGLYLAEFETPPGLQMGCVPYRDDKGMCFPRGRFRGWAWNIEIERALRWGYRVKVDHGFCWEKIVHPFRDFVDLCEGKRREHSGQGVEMIFKTAQNAVYGKLGTKPEGTELLVSPIASETPNLAYDLACEGWMLPEPGTPLARLYLWIREIERSSAYMLPHWSGWVTAHARGILFDAIEAVRGRDDGKRSPGCGDVICGDTDSLKLERRFVEDLRPSGKIMIGGNYGEWKIDAEYKIFRAYAPKCYAFLEWGPGPRRGGGDYRGKAKGIPQGRQTGRFQMRAFRGASPRVRWKSSPNLLAILKGKPNALIGRSRVASVLEHSDSWSADAAGDVRAVEIARGERVKYGR